MSQPIFRISKLSCSYSHKDQDRVLYIEDLEIPRGNIVFLLGASGSGKSTLLETLGLMNDTFADGSVEFYPEPNHAAIRLEDLWYQSNSSGLADIRKKHYSFIFQNTNLMEHFTAYENICLAPMIQSGDKFGASIEDAKVLMEKVNIPEAQVGLDTLSMHLSGGQKQRVTFVRALISDHTVLFCDEPTGNLDERNAYELMRLIKSSMNENKTVIIVSHDIRLAMEFADQIICISKDEGDQSSSIVSRNIFRRHEWSSLDEHGKERFKLRVLEAYDKVTDLYKNDVVKETGQKLNADLNYAKLFKLKEGRILRGKNRRNAAVITCLLLFTFIALGFANGALAYLQKKLNDPFVSWMTMGVPAMRTGESGDVVDVMNVLNADTTRKKMNINSVSGFTEYTLRFKTTDQSKARTIRGRTVSPGIDLIIKDVFKEGNVISGEPFKYQKDFGVVCSKKMLVDLGLSDSIGFVYMEKKFQHAWLDSSIVIAVPLPVRAVVQELPGKIDFLTTDYFYNALRQTPPNPFDIRDKDDIRIFIRADETKAKQLADAVEQNLLSTSIPGAEIIVNEPEAHKASNMTGFDIVVQFLGSDFKMSSVDSLGFELMKLPEIVAMGNDAMRIYAYDSFDEDFTGKYSYTGISMNLNSLSQVRELRDFVFNSFNEDSGGAIIEIDITKVREKENYYFMSNITRLISWLLIFFASLCIGLFLYNMLNTHLSKVKPTLGTFKAFGLNDKSMRRIYIFIIFRFLLVSMLIALGCSYGIGVLINQYTASSSTMEEGNTYFNLIQTNTALTIGIIVLTTLVVSLLTIRRILSKTPGDLIYGR
jgi:putative ABC transport system ATP-binding protein